MATKELSSTLERIRHSCSSLFSSRPEFADLVSSVKETVNSVSDRLGKRSRLLEVEESLNRGLKRINCEIGRCPQQTLALRVEILRGSFLLARVQLQKMIDNSICAHCKYVHAFLRSLPLTNFASSFCTQLSLVSRFFGSAGMGHSAAIIFVLRKRWILLLSPFRCERSDCSIHCPDSICNCSIVSSVHFDGAASQRSCFC